MAKGTTIDGCVYLMRHGCTVLDLERRSDGWLDLPLSNDGQLSVIPAQQYLKAIPLSCIYAPSLKRTQETASIVASGNVSEPDVETSDAAKTWNLGTLAGVRKRYGHPAVQRLMGNPTEAPLGGESYADFKKRFMPWFKKRMAGAKSGGPILVVCSGSNLRCIGKELFGDTSALDMDEGGLAVLRLSGGAWHPEIIFGAKDEGPELPGQALGDYAAATAGGKSAIDDALDFGRPMS